MRTLFIQVYKIIRDPRNARWYISGLGRCPRYPEIDAEIFSQGPQDGSS